MIQGKIDTISAAAWQDDAPTSLASCATSAALVTLDDVDAALMAEWNDLVAQSADCNVFAEPWLLLAGMQHCHGANGVQLALIRDQSGRLIGLFALDRIAGIGRFPMPAFALWRHPNAFLSPGIAVRGGEAAAWSALIDLLAPLRPRATCLLVDGIVGGSALHHGLIDATAGTHLPLLTDHCFDRALLASSLTPDAYWQAAVRSKRRKELRRKWARLAEEGVLTTDRLLPTSNIEPWIEEFHALEASGWKGDNGSALSSHPDTQAFFNTALCDGHAQGKIAITALRLDGRAIAMLVTLVSGAGGFSFKTAFDEDYSRFSPGVLLQRESLDLIATHKLAWIDSCAAPDHPMIDRLWRERRTILRLAMPLPSALNKARFAATMTAQRLWHRAKQRGQQPVNLVPPPSSDQGDDQP